MTTPFPNQPLPFEGRNLYTIDEALQAAVRSLGASTSEAQLVEWGATLGAGRTYALADAANRNPPALRAFDRRGERIDDVVFHPAWDALMRAAMAAGEHAAPWRAPGPGAQVARAAMYYLHAQVENGTQCPLTMTYASVPLLMRHAAMLPSDAWLSRVLATDYDPRPLPVGDKRSALIGMGMTERQGGSDVRANRTRAEQEPDGTWRIGGHKWFFSAPQCDAHVILAQTGDGLGCFLMPRFTPEGRRNAVRINRLKDKLGNRSNASAEAEFDGALGWRIGEPGRGIATILEMVQYTRLDCVIGSAGLIRGALAAALDHARQRTTFGRHLVDHPLMANVLADIAIESEAAMALALALARTFDADAPAAERAAARIVIPAAKYWVCKRAIAATAEAMEALGGNGYVEESPLPRLYREAPVNSIWEGSGNIVCLDVARAARKEPESVDALLCVLGQSRGMHAAFDRHLAMLADTLREPAPDPAAARRVAQAVAVAASAATLIRLAPAFVAEAYCASRLAPGDAYAGAAFGTLPRVVATGGLLERALTP